MFKPKGYNSLSPYLISNDGQKLIDFATAAFGGVETRRFNLKNGKIMHAEVKIDDTIIMLADEGDGFPAYPISLHLYVPDVDATYAKALAAGGTAVQEPINKDDPDKRGGVKDPTGNIWWVSTQIDQE